MTSTAAGQPAGWTKMPTLKSFIPFLLVNIHDTIAVLTGGMPLPWLGGLGELVFIALYLATISTALDDDRHDSRTPRLLLAGLAVVTYALAVGYWNHWQMCFPLLSLATGVVLRRDTRLIAFALALLGITYGIMASLRGAHDTTGDIVAAGWGTGLAGMLAANLLNLVESNSALRATREQLAHAAVERERLRFSRDLHDLLGHTLSVMVVKAQAVRRLGPRDLDAALSQAADIEAVGRQALTEIREAVTGYRESSLATELDNARSLLEASGIAAEISQSGPPLPPQTGALLGWVVREGVTNVVRHSGASHCAIEVRGEPDRVHLEITDDGVGPAAGPEMERPRPKTGGNGLRGLAERLATAGGSLTSGPAGRRGFRLVAELPVDDEEGLAA
ncbi:sensor histidine kinase [Streptomyces sp. NPDC052396]|uniref:sensor histidine kinase n=1 Tax=Streptomyces sp. NPDC052396 TaxID=3365689 RepID=UPI0037D099AB